MKSIVEEASSVVKAIEKGWQRAGKPEEFSVKVFDVAEKNFFGMTTKSAKIALFFKAVETSSPSRPARKDRPRERVDRAKHGNQPGRTQTPTAKRTPGQQQQQPKQQDKRKKQQTAQSRPAQQPKQAQQPKKVRADIWTPEMIAQAEAWIKSSLKVLDLEHVSFSMEAGKYALRFTFNSPIVTDPEKEKKLFRSWAHLLMQTIRNKHKKHFRGAKVILKSK